MSKIKTKKVDPLTCVLTLILVIFASNLTFSSGIMFLGSSKIGESQIIVPQPYSSYMAIPLWIMLGYLLTLVVNEEVNQQ